MSDREFGLIPRIHNQNKATLQWLRELTAEYPRHPVYGIDYSNAVDCAIVTCVVNYGGEVLLVHRGPNVLVYPDTWGLISGFMPLELPDRVILNELAEEVGIHAKDIATLTIAKRRLRLDPELRNSAGDYSRRWHEFRTFAVLHQEVTPITNWENREARWVPIDEALTLPLLPSARRTLLAWLRICGSPLV
ncbi:MAG TPA: NUDIX domain-containing protein [Candidatus Saccharimonas sp.]|nr:NUDIX domain-containing protein [Candidatus Saccharimonas sp.]